MFENYSVPKEWDISEALDQKTYLCNNELVVWGGDVEEVFSPICEVVGERVVQKKLGSYPLMGEKEALKTLDAAKAAYDEGRGEWPTMSVDDRIACVENFTKKMLQKRKEIVKRLMWEIAKSLEDSNNEFDRTIEYIQDTIDELKKLEKDSSKLTTEQDILAQTRRAPLGVVLCMGPYNYPLNETFATLLPALIMGNTVIFKPPKVGVLLHEPLLEAFRDSFPKGVVNTAYGHDVVEPLMSSGAVDVLAFIGSSKSAQIIKNQHPKPHRLKSILGLEAKNPAIVLADADLESAVSECVLGSLAFNGQRCTALKILFIHRSLKSEFLKRFTQEVDDLKQGLPWEDGVRITPLPDIYRRDHQLELIEDALSKGAKLANKQVQMQGTFMTPAVLVDVKKGMRVYEEEQFGPVVPIVVFDDVETPLEYIVDSDYAQQVSIFGSDSKELDEMINPLLNQVCRININTKCQRGPDIFPFTGRKDSAEGTLSVPDALREFSIETMVATRTNVQNKALIEKILV
jgi:glyceraldehyde-3-phosphate dehydrogenase (NADP+)